MCVHTIIRGRDLEIFLSLEYLIKCPRSSKELFKEIQSIVRNFLDSPSCIESPGIVSFLDTKKRSAVCESWVFPKLCRRRAWCYSYVTAFALPESQSRKNR